MNFYFCNQKYKIGRNMKKGIYLILLSNFLIGQVGINVSTPQSTLDIRGTNHQGANTATDGLLIPRVNSLGVNGTVNGQMIYLTANDATNGFSKGFHYWTGSVWNPFEDKDWYNASTAGNATSIDDNIYTLGTVSIGKKQQNNGVLNVFGSAKNDLTIQTSNYNIDHGIAFQNPGGAYTYDIYKHNAGGYAGDLRFAGNTAPQTSIDDLVDYITFTKAGYVGIGTMAPTSKLEV